MNQLFLDLEDQWLFLDTTFYATCLRNKYQPAFFSTPTAIFFEGMGSTPQQWYGKAGELFSIPYREFFMP